ncbi:MAG: phage minor head protein [Pseudomonadota bacterium]
MSINLASLVRGRKALGMGKRKIGKLKPIHPSKANDLWYKSQLLAIVKKLRAITEQEIRSAAVENQMPKNAAFDDVPNWIGGAIKLASKKFGNINRQAQQLSTLAATRNLNSVDASFSSGIKTAFGIDVASVLSIDAIREPFTLAIKANVELITSFAPEYHQKILDAVYKNWAGGMGQESLFDTVMNMGDVAESRAQLIARDQTSKMNGAFTRARQESVGITKYVWQTSGDERVREEHASLDGETFSWDEPPEVGNPGDDFNCRCVALPVIETEDEESFGFGQAVNMAMTGFGIGQALGDL